MNRWTNKTKSIWTLFRCKTAFTLHFGEIDILLTQRTSQFDSQTRRRSVAREQEIKRARVRARARARKSEREKKCRQEISSETPDFLKSAAIQNIRYMSIHVCVW